MQPSAAGIVRAFRSHYSSLERKTELPTKMTMQSSVTVKLNIALKITLGALFCLSCPLLANAADQANIDKRDLASAIATARDMPRLHSLLVSRDSDLIVEEYFNGRDRSQSANVKSVSKSFMSALIGIAIDQDVLGGADQEIGEFFKDHLTTGTPKSAITIGNLLSMQAGLETTSFYNYGAWVLSDDWLGYALRQPVQATPGTRMIYSTGNTHLLSGILTRASGRSSLAFAQEFLLRPLGIRLTSWQQDPDGVYFGGNNMEFRPSDLLAFGQLYLDGGKANGIQIVSADWIEQSTRRIVESSREQGRYYGYGWWSRDMAGHAATYAWGFGGQFVMLVPDLELVIVATSSADPGNNRRRHTRQLYNLLEQIVGRVSGLQSDTVTATGK